MGAPKNVAWRRSLRVAEHLGDRKRLLQRAVRHFPSCDPSFVRKVSTHLLRECQSPSSLWFGTQRNPIYSATVVSRRARCATEHTNCGPGGLPARPYP